MWTYRAAVRTPLEDNASHSTPTPCQQAVAPFCVPEGRWPFGCLEGPRKTPWGVVHEMEAACCYGGGEERVWTGCRGAQGTHIRPGPSGPSGAEKNQPPLAWPAGGPVSCLRAEPAWPWIPVPRTVLWSDAPRLGRLSPRWPSLLPKPWGPRAKFLVGKQPAHITAHTNHTCFFLSYFTFLLSSKFPQ